VSHTHDGDQSEEKLGLRIVRSDVRGSENARSDLHSAGRSGLTRRDTGQYSRDWSKPLTPTQVEVLKEVIETETDWTWSQFETQLEHEENMRIT